MATLIKDTKVYFYAAGAGVLPPSAWCAEVVNGGDTKKLRGHSVSENHRRLAIRACIEVLNTLPAGSTIKIIATDSHLSQWVFDQLRDDDDYSGREKKKAQNLDLFPALRSAKAKHESVKVEIVPKHRMSLRHELVMNETKALLAEVRSSVTPAIMRKQEAQNVDVPF